MVSCSCQLNGQVTWRRSQLIVLEFNNTSTLWVILCSLQEKGRKEIDKIVEEMKERDREKEEQE